MLGNYSKLVWKFNKITRQSIQEKNDRHLIKYYVKKEKQMYFGIGNFSFVIICCQLNFDNSKKNAVEPKIHNIKRIW